MALSLRSTLTPTRPAPTTRRGGDRDAGRTVVVIGAGMGGLSSAIRVAAAGWSVVLLDPLERAGGKVGESRHSGVAFDTGPSVLTLPRVLASVLADAGIALEDALTLRQPDPATRYAFDDGTVLDVRHRPADTLDEVRDKLGGPAADDLAGFLSYAKGIWDTAAPTFVFAPAPSAMSLMRLGVGGLGKVARIDAMRTMGAAIDSRVADPRLRVILRRYATYNGSHPDRAPATLNCIAHVEMGEGLYGVEGGMARVADALVRAATEVGVQVRLGRAARKIVTRRGRVVGVELDDGETVGCAAVVANADARHVRRRLLAEPQPAPGTDEAVSMSGWTGMVKARRRHAPERVGHTVLLSEHYADEFTDIFDRGRPPRQPVVYLCAQEKAHARDGWDEHEPVFIMANAPAVFGAEDADAALALRETVLSRLRARGLIDNDDDIIWERTPGDLARAFPDTGGAIYGASSNSQLAAFKRPANRAKGVKGLYFASGSAHPGGGLPLCLQSGRLAADALVEDLGVHRATEAA